MFLHRAVQHELEVWDVLCDCAIGAAIGALARAIAVQGRTYEGEEETSSEILFDYTISVDICRYINIIISIYKH